MLSAAARPVTSVLVWYKGGETSALYPVFFLVFLCTVQSVQIRSISPGQKWPGFSFALHLLRVQGFYFALLQYSHAQAFTVRFVSSMQLYRPQHKTARRDLQALFLRFATFYRRRYQAYTNGYNAACDTLEHITAPQHLQHIPDTRATPDAVQASTDRLL